MFKQDTALRQTRRFGGIEFVPSSIQVRSYGEKGSHVSSISENETRYNDFVPLIYGTAWYSPSIVFARNDGNLTRMEVLLGIGEIQDVIKVLINNIEIPVGQAGRNMTATGWFNVVTKGGRTGSFNLDFTDAAGNPLGDPYGGMALISVVVPNRINDGRSLPSIQALIQGLKLPRYGSDGAWLGEQFTNNPAWILLDILSRSGWSTDEIDLASFAGAATYCDEQIETQDLHGRSITVPRFQCNLVLGKRRSAGDLIRGIRNTSRLYLTYGLGGLLKLNVENTIQLQQPAKAEWSNSIVSLNGGWPSYEFGDGTAGVSGILRRQNGEPAIRLWSRSTTETPNRFAVEFQDALNEFQQDSFSLVDADDVARTGQEITAPLTALGLPHYDQAARILKFNLDKSLYGNTYIEFETSVKALGVTPGDLIAVTYLKEGFDRQLFRVLKIAPEMNYRTAKLTAQIHKDAWYTDTNGQVAGDAGTRRQPGSGTGLPRPLVGTILDPNGDINFAITETSSAAADGGSILNASVGFLSPPSAQSGGPGIPLVSLAATIATTGGSLAGGQNLYYAVSAVDGGGLEGGLSFIVRAFITAGTNTNTVNLSGLSFAATAAGFNAYRGVNPEQMFRIASSQPLSAQFSDTGLAKQISAPVDSNYDHANFYWRLELQPEFTVTLHSANSAGNDTLQMIANAYRGMTTRITRGKGAGQERAVIANTNTTVTLSSRWDTEPDATSYFVITESGWHFGATGKTSPVQFEIPNRTGAIIHISGRAANVNDVESSFELSTLTRWTIGGAGSGALDAGLPPKPSFGLSVSPDNAGTIELGGVSFPTLTNTRTVTAGILSMYYWDELQGQTTFALTASVNDSDTFVDLNNPGSAPAGFFVQMESEIARVEETLNSGTRYRVTRGRLGSTPAAHVPLVRLYHLDKQVTVVPFVRDFFGSPASGSWSYPIFLPDSRVVSAELIVTNANGNSPAADISFTQTVDRGLRTLSGGQFSFQIDGFLAIQNGASPDLIVEASHSVRDIFAVVRQAPSGSPVQIQLNQNGTLYCALTIAGGATISSSVSGLGLPALMAGARISIDILGVGVTNPGSDLTVIMRL